MSSLAVPQLPNDLPRSMDLAGQGVTVLPDASRFPSPLPLPPEEVSFLLVSPPDLHFLFHISSCFIAAHRVAQRILSCCSL